MSELECTPEILLVDDAVANLQVLAGLLADRGYQVRTATSGKSALHSAATQPPDLILLDVRMPEPDGLEVCRRMKCDPRTRSIPVIFISAAHESDEKLAGFAAGGVDYITKPFERAEVLARVNTHLELARTSRSLELARAELERRVADRTRALESATEALRASGERLRMVIEATSDAVWDWHLPTDHLFLSERFYAMLDQLPGKAEGTSADWRERLHPVDASAFDEAVLAHREGRSPQLSVEVRMRTGGATWKWLHCRGKVTERDKTGRPRRMVGTLADISERRAAEDRLLGALREKEVLLREIHHRVKNNLQVVASLLGLQGRAAGEPHARELFEESAARVSSMAMAHEQLYRSADLSSIDFASYLRQLARHLSARAGRRDVVVDLRAQPCTLSLEVAVPCGLICNELLSNAFRHAFPGGRSGRILLEAGTTPDGGLLLAVADDGVGFPDGFRPEEASSLGWRMISSLAHQLGGDIRIPSRSPVRVEWEVPQHCRRGGAPSPVAEARSASSAEGEGA